MSYSKLDSTSTMVVRNIVRDAQDEPISSTTPAEYTIAEVMGAGGFKQGAAVPDAAAAPTKAEFDALLTSLRDAGIIATV